MTRTKKTSLKVGDKVAFASGNYSSLTGIITEIDWNSKDAIYGFCHIVQLSNGHIEKSEHWQFA